MSKAQARVALVCAVVGLAASGFAAYVHYHLLHDPAYVSVCDVSASVSCTQVYASRFATVRGIPVAIFGAIWFAVALLLSLVGLAGPPAARESAPGYLFAGSTLALAVVLYLGYASFALLKVVCPVCLITYAAVIGLFVVTGAATTFPMMSLPGRASRDLKTLVSSPLALVVTLLLAGASVSAVALFPREPGIGGAGDNLQASQDQRSEFERYYASRRRVPLVVPTAGAKVLIVDFSDFQCPFCKQAYESLRPIIAKYNAQAPNTVRLVLKDYPLDSECNVNVSGGGPHPAACEAAAAVRLARQHNRGDAMEEWLFSHQPEMTPATVRQAARDIGQVPDFDAKYAETLELVKGDVSMGHSLSVKSTPTLFINGAMVEGVLAPQYLDQAIAYELQHPPAR